MTDTSSPYALRTIDQILAIPDEGNFLSELLQENADLIAELQDHQKAYGGAPKGSLSISIAYELGKGGIVNMKASFATKAPKTPAASAVAWVTRDGDLTPENPAQMKLNLRDATAHDRQIKSV